MLNPGLKVMQLGSPTGLYGAERWILALVRYMDPGRVTTIVSSIKDAPELEVPLCQEAERMGFQTRIFNSPGRINFRSVTALGRYVKDQRVDILHTHGYKQDLIGLLAARLAGCRIVSTPHGWSRDAGMALKCYEGLNRAVFPFFDGVAPLSMELYQELKKIPGMGSRLIYIQNGVDTDEIDACKTVADEISVWKKKGCFVIGYIGQLIPRKGLRTLLSATARLDSKLNFRVAIVGEGPQREELETLSRDLGICDRVRFFGFRADRLNLLKGFNLFVLPSSLEGIPRCLMEAMAAGVPVLASDIPGTRQLVRKNVNGRLFGQGNVSELQGLLAESMAVPETLQPGVASARHLIHSRFSAKGMAAHYENLFQRLVSGTAATAAAGKS